MKRVILFITIAAMAMGCGSSSGTPDAGGQDDLIALPDVVEAEDTDLSDLVDPVDILTAEDTQDLEVTVDVVVPEDVVAPEDVEVLADLADVPPPPDQDEDGIPDDTDNCPETSNPDQADCDFNNVGDACEPDQVDTDEDGEPNFCDQDDDNDGVSDSEDAFPLDPTESMDSDGDEVGDNADTDDDNDGLLDTEEEIFGQDCAQTDPKDSDTDNDGVLDGADAYPNDPFPAFLTQENIMGTIMVTLSDGAGGFNPSFDVGQPLGRCAGSGAACSFDGECVGAAATGICDFGVCAPPDSNCKAPNLCSGTEYCSDSYCVDLNEDLCSEGCPGGTYCRQRVYRFVSIADFDADGKMDFIAHSHPEELDGTRQLWYFKRLSSDGGNFPQQFLGHTDGLIYGTVADVDGDNHFDVVRFKNTKPSNLQDVTGTTYLGNPISLNTSCAVGTEEEECAFTRVEDCFDITSIVVNQWNAPRAREAQDLNSDGLNDLVFGVYSSGGNTNTDVYYLPSNGDGTFGDAVAIFTHNSNGSQGPTNAMVFADFNNDEAGDVLMGFDDDGDAGSAWLYEGSSDGSFAPETATKVLDVNPDCNAGCSDDVGRSSNPKSFDFNFDGNMDLVLGYNHNDVSKPPSKLVIFFGNGDGTFGEEVQVGPSWGGNEGNRFQSPQRICPWYQP